MQIKEFRVMGQNIVEVDSIWEYRKKEIARIEP